MVIPRSINQSTPVKRLGKYQNVWPRHTMQVAIKVD